MTFDTLSLGKLGLLLLSALSFADGQAVHVDMTRRVPSKSLKNLAVGAQRIRTKYASKLQGLHRRDDTSFIDEGTDVGYTIPIGVGTPPQHFTVLVDTGSSDLWVVEQNCFGCNASTPGFDTLSSSTYTSLPVDKPPLTYGDGSSASGALSTDTVTVGSMQLQKQGLFIMSEISGQAVIGTSSGIMGFGWNALAVSGAIPFWQTVLNTSSATNSSSTTSSSSTSNQFGIFITRRSNPFDLTADSANGPITEEPGGTLTIGGANTSFYTGDIEYAALTNPFPKSLDYWTLNISSLSSNGQQASLSAPRSAIIDSGTTLIYGPASDVASFYKTIPGSVSLEAQSANFAGVYAYPCSTKLGVTIAFGGSEWAISDIDMNAGPVSGLRSSAEMCVGSIMASSGLDEEDPNAYPAWIVGDTLLKNVYSVYREQPPAVGFAKLSDFAIAQSPVSPTTTGGSSSGKKSAAAVVSPTTMSRAIIYTLLLVNGMLAISL